MLRNDDCAVFFYTYRHKALKGMAEIICLKKIPRRFYIYFNKVYMIEVHRLTGVGVVGVNGLE